MARPGNVKIAIKGVRKRDWYCALTKLVVMKAYEKTRVKI